jgi:formate/nitrite transporter
MIVLSGADLFTSNIMFMITAFLRKSKFIFSRNASSRPTTTIIDRRVSIWDVAKNWFFSFFGNLAGSLFFMAVITGYGHVFQETPEYAHTSVTIAVQKAYDPQWHQIFLRAIGANWLVCFAVFISISSREIASKIIAIWWPTATFVALALDHVIANMFFIPMGIWCGAPFGAGYYIWKSLIPTLLGNLVGGGLFVGAAYWYLYLTGEDGVQVDFNMGSLATAMEAGGPLRRTQTDRDRARQYMGDGTTIVGQDPYGNGAQQCPMVAYGHGNGQMMSALAKELSDASPWAKTHAERKAMGSGNNSPPEEKV